MAKCPTCQMSFSVPAGDNPAEHGCPRCGLPGEGDCPECGYRGPLHTEVTVEGSDRDGNRGVRVTWTQCPDCGEDIENDCPF